MDYIEREKLKKDLLHKGFYPVLVKRAIENAPTEDVVPRAEVERWQLKYKSDIETCDSTIHRLHNILLQFTDIVHKWGNKNGIDTTEISLVPILEQEADNIITKAKQKVAKQIFEEIENIIARNTQHGFKGKYKVHCITGFNGRQITRLIAEFKKKYIGE